MAKLHHLMSSASNHTPLVLQMVNKNQKKRAKMMFQFELMWLKDQRCSTVITEAWEEGLSTKNYVLGNCIEKCRTRLDIWNKIEFGHVGKTISE